MYINSYTATKCLNISFGRSSRDRQRQRKADRPGQFNSKERERERNSKSAVLKDDTASLNAIHAACTQHHWGRDKKKSQTCHELQLRLTLMSS